MQGLISGVFLVVLFAAVAAAAALLSVRMLIATRASGPRRSPDA